MMTMRISDAVPCWPRFLPSLLVGMLVVTGAVGKRKKDDNILSTPVDTIEWLVRILLVEYIGMPRRNMVKSP